jgi:Outer membrane lipoprotein carrier protein LolA-like
VSARRSPGVAGWLLLALATAAAALEPAVPPDRLDTLLQQLAVRRHGHVTFSEVQYLAVLERPLESSGELLYEAPDRLEKRTLSPRPETLVLAHGVLSATRNGRTRTLELAALPQLAPLIEGLRATLAGDRAALERAFSVRLEGDTARWTLHLAPRDPAAARLVREVLISGEHSQLRTVEILETDGDRSLLTIGRELPP